MKNHFTISVLAAAALLAACASTPVSPPSLLSARLAVKAAEADDMVLRNAPLELKKAGDALRRADELNAKGATLAAIDSAAYVASRQAETAMAVAKAKGSDDAIKAAETERERARADARTVEANRAKNQAAMARAEANDAKAEANNARADASMAQVQADAAKADANDARARAAAAQSQATVLQQLLVELQTQQTDRGTLVTLGDVLFEFGRADIKPGAKDALRKLASYLQEHPERSVLIEGYTDSVGSDTANLTLSQRRAESVAIALETLGVRDARISVRGYGKSYPVAENSSDTNRALNRRVEVYISDNDKPVRARG